MAKQIAGPNLNVVKSNLEVLSTLDLLDNKAGVEYSGSSSSPFTALNNVAYATSLLSETGIDLGIDYSSYANFIHFGSAEERLSHFKDKLEDIEFHESSSKSISNNLSAASAYQSSSVNYHIDAASTILREFDHYDRYLYFKSSSYTWPKDANGNLLPTTASAAITWYNTQLSASQDFDLNNDNRIINTLPDYIKEDATNNPAIVFCDMIGQHYDNLMVYAQGISQKHDTDNRLDIGASRDLIGDILKSLGVKLYDSQFKSLDLGRLYVGSFYPTGSEVINTQISASESIIPAKDHLDSVNKRLYHNIAHLLQVKGTRRGLRALINAFGVPSDVLPIREFGGVRTESPNLGPNTSFTSSLDKVRLDNTGSLLSGSTLSLYSTATTSPELYSYDNHIVEVGWSPTQLKDDYIASQVSSTFNIDDYIGDPRDRFNKNYTDLTDFTKTVLNTSEDRTIYDFLRLLKYYDNQMFAMLEDFVPARTSLRKGAIIKPHVLERSKANLGQTSITQATYSGSLDMYTVTGSEGGVVAFDTTNTVTTNTITGSVTEIITDQRERFNGELGGSTITVTTGELNVDNPLKRLSSLPLNYDVTVRTNLDTFNNSTIGTGEMEMYYFDFETEMLVAPPEEPPGVLPFGVTQEDISLEIINTNSFIEGLGVSLTRVESDVYNDDDVLIYSTTQAGSYTISGIAYTGDDIVVQAYAFDTGNPPSSITVEIKNGATTIETGTATASVTVTNDPGELVVGSATLVIQVRIS